MLICIFHLLWSMLYCILSGMWWSFIINNNIITYRGIPPILHKFSLFFSACRTCCTFGVFCALGEFSGNHKVVVIFIKESGTNLSVGSFKEVAIRGRKETGMGSQYFGAWLKLGALSGLCSTDFFIFRPITLVGPISYESARVHN